MSKTSLYVFNLTEFSLLRFIYSAITRRSFTLFDTKPILPGTAFCLNLVASWAKQRPNYKESPYQAIWREKMKQDPSYFFRSDTFSKSEAWSESHFNFTGLTIDENDYARPVKQLTSSWVNDLFPTTYALRDLIEQVSPQSFKLFGFDYNFACLFNHLFPKTKILSNFQVKSSWLANLFIMLITSLYGIIWTISRVRFCQPRKMMHLGADFVTDNTYPYILRGIAGSDQDDVMIILRSEKQRDDYKSLLGHYPAVNVEKGFFTPVSACLAILHILRFSPTLFFRHHSNSPHLYFQIGLLPYRRMIFRALFYTYHFQFFWSRDPYSVQHILRSQELRRIGAVSLGLMHALPATVIRMSIWRYIDYDFFYTFGEGIKKYYRDTWPNYMEVRPVGVFRATTELLQQATGPKSNDIGIFVVPCEDAQFMVDLICRVANAFPKRWILLKIKPGYEYLHSDQFIREAIKKGPDNIIISNEDSYELMAKVKFVISNPSSVIAEAIAFGAYSFAIDINDYLETYYFRDFPEICINNVVDLIERINAIDAETEVYPIENLTELISLDGPPFFEIVKQDMTRPAIN